MDDKIFDVEYNGVYSDAKYMSDLVLLFNGFELKFKYIKKINVSIEEQIVSDPKYKNDDSIVESEDGKEITCTFYGNRYRDAKLKLSKPEDLYSHIKKKLNELLDKDKEKLKNNQEEE